jgi:hypothetical protein
LFSPALKIVSSLFSRISDLILIDGSTLLFARQGSSRDLDHQTARPYGPSEAGIRRRKSVACHAFQQRMFKFTADREMIGISALETQMAVFQ